MNPAVMSEALALVARARANGHTGSVGDAAEWERLSSDLGGIIPEWYIELTTSVPLVGLEIGWQSSEPEQDDDGLAWLYWMGADDTRSEALEAYPGIAVVRRGYICVASCLHRTGDQYFIPTNQGDDPPLYNTYHDVGDSADEILDGGREVAASSLPEFFRTSRVESRPSYL